MKRAAITYILEVAKYGKRFGLYYVLGFETH